MTLGMPYTLRDYQRQAADRAVQYFRNPIGGNGVIVLPTGAGKSLVIAEIAYRLDAPVLIFQPSKEILEQNHAKLQNYGVTDCGIYSASCGRKDISRITFATIGSVKGHKAYFARFRYVIVDECHLVNPEEGMYRDFFAAIRCHVLGLTATPFRLYSSQFYGSMLRFITRMRTRIFTQVLYCCQVGELSRRGFLAPLKYYPVSCIDRGRLRLNSTGAEYSDGSVRAEYARAKYAECLSDVVGRLLAAKRRSVLVFTRFTEEARYLASLDPERRAVVSGDTPKAERECILADFKAGRLHVVANVGVLTTGFDFPALSTVVLARPTMSLALYYQMVGRAIRPYPGKEPWVVDLCGNCQRFGRVEDLVMYQDPRGLWAVYSHGRQLTNIFFNKQ